MIRIVDTRQDQGFQRHTDGEDSNETVESEITILVYLSTPEYGPTIVYADIFDLTGNEYDCITGSMMLMDHDIEHKGATVVGKKTTLRTTIFYYKTNLDFFKTINSFEDIESSFLKHFPGINVSELIPTKMEWIEILEKNYKTIFFIFENKKLIFKEKKYEDCEKCNKCYLEEI